MTCPSPRRAAAASALVCLTLLLPSAGHAVPRSGKPGSAITALDRIVAGPLSGLLDRLAALLPGNSASKRGSSIDPNGATTENGSAIDPFGSTSDSGSGLDPNGRT